MAQVTDYTVSNQTFPNTRADLNNIFAAIATNNSGTSAPSNQQAGQWWIDTTSSTWILYIHDGTDDIQFATIDTSANTVNFTDSALDVVTDTTPQLGGDLDLNSNDITGTGNINITGTATVTGLTTTGNINFGDNDKANFGASNDLQIYHDGSDSYIDDVGAGNLIMKAGSLRIKASNDESMIDGNANGAVNLYYDNALKLATTSSGVTVTGTLTADGIALGDNEYINIGASNDLQIYHDGTHSRIDDAGTGKLILRGNASVLLQKYTGENMAEFTADGAVDLYWNDFKKLETTSSGATVTGTLTATAFSGDGSALTGVGGGITEADIWRLTTSFTGGASPISSNWERADDASFSKIGTGMSQSSGVFTFPSTGIWWVIYHCQIQLNDSADNQVFATVQHSPNNGTTLDAVSYGLTGDGQTGSRNTVVSSSFVDITDTSTHSVRFLVESQDVNNTTVGSSTENQTWVEFIRLGDT
jgi:hypothetical protein